MQFMNRNCEPSGEMVKFMKNSEFYRIAPYTEGPAGMLVVQDKQVTDSDGKKVWRAVLFWPISKAEIIFDEDLHAPAWDDPDTVAASALAFFSLKSGDTDAEYFDGYSDLQLLWRDEHAEYVAGLIDGESLKHLKIG